MAQGTFLDLLIRLEALKRIFVFHPKTYLLPGGKPKVFNQK